jgi:hypothetical protein
LTAYSITVSNSLRAFGGGPPSLWNAYAWNAFKWGEGTATIPHQVVHLVSTSLSLDSARAGGDIVHLVSETLALDSGYGFNLTFQVSNNLTVESETTEEVLQDGSGYSYVFPDRVTNLERRTTTTWASAAASAAAWTSGTATSTTWSVR